MRVAPGTRLGHYEILAAIGAGGMGEVYRARDTRLQRPAAIKVITAEDGDADRVRRLEHEALAASALNHPNILTVYEFGVHDGLQYIATELVEGDTLRDRIRGGPIQLLPALDIAVQIAAALDAAHAAGIVHRDVKPENVMVRPDGYVKVLDFGIAKLLPSSPAAAESNTLTVQTVPGILLGTVGYMAPEQIRGLPVDHRADVWSLGVVLHEMLSGRSPFSGPTMSDVIAAVLERAPPPLSSSGIDAPPELERIIGKALAKTREDRYQSMKELSIDLRLVRQQPFPPAPAPAARPSRSLVGGVMLSLLAVAAAAWIGWVGWSGRQQPAGTAFPPAPGTSENAALIPTRSFQYSLSEQRMTNAQAAGDPVASAGAGVFSKTSKFGFRFSNPQRGFVYLINEAPGQSGPVLTMLYPTPSIRGGSAEVRPGEIASTGWYYFDPASDVEHVWIVWSELQLPDLQRAARFVNPDDRGEVKDPSDVKAIKSLLSSDAARNVTAEADPAAKQMTVRGRGGVLVHKAELRSR